MASSKQTATALMKCASCKCEVGKEAGKIPFLVDDHANVDGEKAKHEPFCPTCFVYVRSPREANRWPPGYFVPLHCGKCGLESVAMGQDACMQCGSRIVVVLPPQPNVA